MVDDSVDDGIISDEGDDSHLASAGRTDKRIYLINFSDHLGPAPRWDLRALLLKKGLDSCLAGR